MQSSPIRFITTIPRARSTTIRNESLDDEIVKPIADFSLALLQIDLVAFHKKGPSISLASPPDQLNRATIDMRSATHEIEAAGRQANSALLPCDSTGGGCDRAPPDPTSSPAQDKSSRPEVGRASDRIRTGEPT